MELIRKGRCAEMQEQWMITCNIQHFNAIQHFENHDTVYWRTEASIRRGDIVYIYVGRPYSAVLYKCSVMDDSVAEEEVINVAPYALRANKARSSRTKYIMLGLALSFDSGDLSFKELKKHGLGQVQKTATLDRKLKKYLEDYEVQSHERRGDE